MTGTSPTQPLPYEPFLLAAESAASPTFFEVRFASDGNVFRYGILYDAKRVHEEWLDVYEGAKERDLFSRETNDAGGVAVDLGPAAVGNHSATKIKALAQVGARPNQLFLTEVVNLDNAEAQGPLLGGAVQWFRSTLSVLPAGRGIGTVVETIVEDEAFARFAAEFLREAGTGIADLGVETVEIAKTAHGNEAPILALAEALLSLPGAKAGFAAFSGMEVNPAEPGEGAATVRRVVASHNSALGQPVKFLLTNESDGSRRLLDLLPILYRLANRDGVLVIDELEQSMHPMLARKLVEFFLKASRNKQSQLIFATHESTLLDQDLLRRDGIWFAEKNDEGATHLYSLADFKVRNDLRIEKGYLAGRFGAIPFLGGIDQLIEKEQAAAEPAK